MRPGLQEFRLTASSPHPQERRALLSPFYGCVQPGLQEFRPTASSPRPRERRALLSPFYGCVQPGLQEFRLTASSLRPRERRALSQACRSSDSLPPRCALGRGELSFPHSMALVQTHCLFTAPSGAPRSPFPVLQVRERRLGKIRQLILGRQVSQWPSWGPLGEARARGSPCSGETLPSCPGPLPPGTGGDGAPGTWLMLAGTELPFSLKCPWPHAASAYHTGLD